jgi:menaquinone-dependent protoporphyrinogen IX oxidase
MSKVLVLYYSSYGHTERMAQAVAEGVREACAEADIKRVPELVSEDVAKKSGYKLDQAAPIATVAELPNYDAIIFGSGTRFGVVTRKCGTSSIRPAASGQRVRWSERSDRFSRVPGPSMAARNRPFSR